MEQLWLYIQNTIEKKLKGIIRKVQKTRYETNKINSKTNHNTTKKRDSFYPWVINITNVTSSDKETTLLEKGLFYLKE